MIFSANDDNHQSIAERVEMNLQPHRFDFERPWNSEVHEVETICLKRIHDSAFALEMLRRFKVVEALVSVTLMLLQRIYDCAHDRIGRCGIG